MGCNLVQQAIIFPLAVERQLEAGGYILGELAFLHARPHENQLARGTILAALDTHKLRVYFALVLRNLGRFR